MLAAIADPGVEIVTLTVTEKAYRPGSEIIALLAEGLARRTEPATVLSLDNLPRNGEVLASLVGGGARASVPVHDGRPRRPRDHGRRPRRGRPARSASPITARSSPSRSGSG